MQFNNDLAGGVTLVRAALQSPNYLTGVSGWAVKIDGSAEFNNVIIRGATTSGGVSLYYDGTPALGNLIASISAASGTDSFGNDYIGGVATYSGDSYVAMSTGNVFFGLVSDGYTGAGLAGLSGDDAVFLSSPTISSPEAATISLVGGDTSVTPQSASGYPHVDIGASSNGVTAWLHGAAVYATASGGTSTAETWHTPNFNANWSGTTTFGTISGGLGTLKYRRDAEDNVWVWGTFTAAAGAGSAVAQLPVGYRPVTSTPFPVAFISSGGVAGNAWMYLSSAGNLNINSQLGSAVTTGTTYTVNAKIPLGNVS